MKSIIISKPSGLNGREWVDSHNYIKNLQTMIERIENDDKLSPKNKETITQFVASNSRLSPATLLKNAQVVYAFLKEMNKDIDQITQEDCKNYYIELMSSQRKAWTLRKYVSVLKRFFRWKYGLGKEEAVPLLKTWTSSFSVKKWIDPDSLPSQLKVKQAIESLNLKGTMMEARNQLIIALLNDLGCRIGEILATNLEDAEEVTVQFKDKSFQVLKIKIMQSKTNPRIIFSYLSRPYFKKYLALRGITKENYAQNQNKPLFINNTGQRLHYQTAKEVLKHAFKKIGFKFPKSHACHFLRHVFRSRAENSDCWSQAKLNYWLAHGKGSIEGLYTHLKWDSCVNPYFEMLFREKNEMMLLQCKCGVEVAGQEFCPSCGKQLTDVTVLNSEKFLEQQEEKQKLYERLELMEQNMATLTRALLEKQKVEIKTKTN